MEIVIPKKLKKKKHTHSKEYYHYELVAIYKYHIKYKCQETGMIESFSKNDFVSKLAKKQINMEGKMNNE